MVDSFDPSTHEPPIRVGHEDNDKVPSFGWVKKIEKDGGNLYAYVEFTPEMEEMIKKGNYKKVSASFYSPASEVNPRKGHYTLKHVAMLGGTPPAVKGLEPFGFSESDGEIQSMEMEIEINFEEPVMVKDKEKEALLESEEEKEEEVPSFKEKGKGKVQDMEDEMPEEEEDELLEEEDEDEDEDFGDKKKKHSSSYAGGKKMHSGEEDYACDSKTKKYSEQEDLTVKIQEMEARFAEIQAKEEEAKQLQKRLEEMEAKFAEMESAKADAEARLAEEKRERRREILGQKVENLYSEGQLTEGTYPQQDLFDFAVGLEEGTLEFSEGQTAADKLIEILSKIPAPVDFSEVASDDEPVFAETKEEEESEMDFAERVEKYSIENEITYEEALRILARQTF